MENFGIFEPLLDILNPYFDDPYFRQDEFGSYIYDVNNNEVTLIIHKNPCQFEASVLIEMLADFIIDISQVQSSLGSTNR